MATKTVKKIRLTETSKKILTIIGVIIVILLVIFYIWRSNVNDLKRIGYSEKAAKTIIFKFKKDYCMNFKDNKTLNMAFESADYKEDNLDSYSKITYRKQANLIKNINNLLKKKYSNDEISMIITHGTDKSVTEFSKRDKVRYLQEFYTIDYAKLENYDRYLAYMDEERESDETTVVHVNLDLDKEDYKDAYVIKSFSPTMLVNKHRSLTEDFKVPNLINVPKEYLKDSSDKVQASSVAIKAVKEMINAAKKEGLNIMVNSAYRSYDDQKELEDTYRNLYGEDYVTKFVAKAGFSEHQTGLCFDFAGGSNKIFASSNEYKWVIDNGYKYGFVYRFPKGSEAVTGYQSEAWHYRYVGVKAAKYCYDHDITFDEYYAMFLDK